MRQYFFSSLLGWFHLISSGKICFSYQDHICFGIFCSLKQQNCYFFCIWWCLKCVESLKCLLSAWEMFKTKKKKANIPKEMTIKAVAAIKSKHLSWHKNAPWDRNQTTIFFRHPKWKWKLSPSRWWTSIKSFYCLLTISLLMNLIELLWFLVMIGRNYLRVLSDTPRQATSSKNEFIAIFTLRLFLL